MHVAKGGDPLQVVHGRGSLLVISGGGPPPVVGDGDSPSYWSGWQLTAHTHRSSDSPEEVRGGSPLYMDEVGSPSHIERSSAPLKWQP